VQCQKRVDAIFANLVQDRPRGPEDVYRMLAVREGKKQMTHAKAEDLAFRTLLLGYHRATVDEWRAHVHKLAATLRDYDALQVESSHIDAITDGSSRVLVRDDLIGEVGKRVDGALFMGRLVKHIEVIKFAVDWDRLRGRGSVVFKREFARSTFLRLPHVHSVMKTLEGENASRVFTKQFSKEFEVWKRRQQLIVTARNRLLELYSVFGAGVLMDPTWCVEDLVLHRSKVFVSVLSLVLARAQEDPTIDFDVLRRRGASAVKHAAYVLEGLEAARYVDSFLRDYDPENM